MIIMMIITMFMRMMIVIFMIGDDIRFLQMREAEQRLTEEQETMLGLQQVKINESPLFLPTRTSKAIFWGFAILVENE